jgi:diguanylate cyclase (GGDEF)-like protein
MTIIGFLAEFLFALRGILIGVVALDITFYYLYLHIEHFRFDITTGILNREAFLADIDKLGSARISHIVCIDLNELKRLNDNYGHTEGDKALRATARALRESCVRGCRVYRVGGDEFAAICCGMTTDEVAEMAGRMQENVKKSGYVCAVGSAAWPREKSFTEVYREADDNMYTNKREIKAKKVLEAVADKKAAKV